MSNNKTSTDDDSLIKPRVTRDIFIPTNGFWVSAGQTVDLWKAWLNPGRAFALRYGIYRNIIPCPLNNDLVEEGLLPFTRIEGKGDIHVSWRMNPLKHDCIIFLRAQYLKLDGNVDTWHECTPITKNNDGSNIYITFEDIGSPPHDFALSLRVS